MPSGEVVGLYRKMHIPDDPAYYEKFYFTPGDLGFRAFDTQVGRIATLICWDQWYPEGARLAALQGPSILFYPTAIGWHPAEKEQFGAAQHDAWRTIQRGHAIANGVYVAAVNRVGLEKPPPPAPAWSSGDRLSFAIPLALCWQKPRQSARKHFWRRSTWRASKTCGATGLFFATAELMRTLGLPTVSWTRTRGAKKNRSRAPAALGYRMPASGNRMKPPGLRGRTTSRIGRRNSRPFPGCTVRLFANIAAGEIVRILVNSKAHEEKARRICKRIGVDLKRVEFFCFPTDRGWTRDFGPMFVKRDAPRAGCRHGAFRLYGLGEVSRTGARIPRCRSARRRRSAGGCLKPW